MSAPEMTMVEVTVVLSYPVPADREERYEIYGVSNLEECVGIDFDNDPAAFLLESTLLDMQVTGVS